MGIRDRPILARSPWQNAYAERLIGSIRRKCVDHVIVAGERHLRHVLLSYLSLNKDAPARRAVEQAGHIGCRPVLGGDCIIGTVRQDKPDASSGRKSRSGKGNEPPHRESSLGLMEATT
jgi:hypothetical protein